MSIVPEQQQPRGLIVSGNTNIPKGHALKVTVADRFMGTVIETTSARVLAKGNYKTKAFCRKAGDLKPGMYHVYVSANLGRQTFGNRLSKKPGTRIADRMIGLHTWGSEKSRSVGNIVTFTVGGRKDVAAQLASAKLLAEEYAEIQAELGNIRSRNTLAVNERHRLRRAGQIEVEAANELREFVLETNNSMTAIKKRVGKIKQALAKEVLESDARQAEAEFDEQWNPDIKSRERASAFIYDQRKLHLSARQYGYSLRNLTLRAESELVNDGFRKLEDTDGNEIEVRIFSAMNGGFVTQGRDGLTKFYSNDELTKESRKNLGRPMYVDAHLVTHQRNLVISP